MNPVEVCAFHDSVTGTLSYVVWSQRSLDAVVIDPLLDFDPVSGAVGECSLRRLMRFVSAKNLRVHWILDTHVHADHLSGARQLRQLWPWSRWGMARSLSRVFANFKGVYGWPGSVRLEDLGVERWFSDREEFTAGQLTIQAFETPGHTPACLTYRIGVHLFTGDALMMPDSGVGRCDFPDGSASALYDSIWGVLYALPDSYKTHPGHDYRPGGRPMRHSATLGEQKRGNIHLRTSTSRADFVQFREARDKTLTAPKLIDPSLDWNLGAYRLVKPLN